MAGAAPAAAGGLSRVYCQTGYSALSRLGRACCFAGQTVVALIGLGLVLWAAGCRSTSLDKESSAIPVGKSAAKPVNGVVAPELVHLIAGFEPGGDLRAWDLKQVSGQLETNWASEGVGAARLHYPQWRVGTNKWPAAMLDFGSGGFRREDWSSFSQLHFEVYNQHAVQLALKLRLDDGAGKRATYVFAVPPRQSYTCTVEIAQLARSINTKEVVHFNLFMTQPDRDYTLLIDNIRLVAAPLDFGQVQLLLDPFDGGRVEVVVRTNRRVDLAVEVQGPDRVFQRRGGSGTSWHWRQEEELDPGRYRAVLHYVDPLDPQQNKYQRALGHFKVAPSERRPMTAAWYEPTTRKVMLSSKPGAAGEKVLRWDSSGHLLNSPGEGLGVHMAQNEYEGIQVVFLRQESARIRVALEELRHSATGVPFPLRDSRIYQVGYVRTRQPEEYPVEAVGWWPDPLFEQAEIDVAAGECAPVWLRFKSRQTTPAGIYQGQLGVWVDDKRLGAVPLEVRVYPVALADTTAVQTTFSLYYHMLDQLYGGRTPFRIKERYEAFVAEHRLNVDWIYRQEPPDFKGVLARARQGQLNAFNLYYLEKGYYSPTRLEAIAAKLTPYVERLRREGLAHRAYLYGFDEVTSEHFGQLRRVFSYFKERFPDIRTVTSAKDPSFGLDSGLDQVVDVWVPLIPFYDPQAAAAARQRGKEVWWYICIAPLSPYPNWFVEYSGLEPRLVWWMTYQFQVPGFLYYSLNRWPGHRVPMRLTKGNKTDWNPASFGTANGDGCLFYGGPDGPITTLRLENVRDGIEDYELLKALGDKERDNGAGGRALCAQLIRSRSNFVRDTQTFAQVRRQLLAAAAN